MERHVRMLQPEEGDIYSSALVQLPTPRMVLFYNGPGRIQDHLYLSDAYENSTDPDIEARIRVINISSGQSALLQQCSSLQDYTTFVEAFQRYRADHRFSDRAAASRAIAELRNGEVKTYLVGHEAEVIDMLLTEYDEVKTLKAERYVGRREGLEQGREEERLRTLCELVAEGDLPIEKAIEKAAGYGVTNESDLRSRAADLGIQLPET